MTMWRERGPGNETRIMDPSAHGTTKKLDRKTVEKNRRIHMKALCSVLDALIPPSPNAKEGVAVPLPDRIDEAIGHIKELQERIEGMKGRKRRMTTISNSTEGGLMFGGVRSPLSKLEVQDSGSGGLKIVAVSGSAADDRVMFRNLVETLEEEGIEILSANYDVVDGDKALHIIHASVGGARRLEAYELSKILRNKGAHGGA